MNMLRKLQLYESDEKLLEVKHMSGRFFVG